MREHRIVLDDFEVRALRAGELSVLFRPVAHQNRVHADCHLVQYTQDNGLAAYWVWEWRKDGHGKPAGGGTYAGIPPFECPFGWTGDRLWVAEAWLDTWGDESEPEDASDRGGGVLYRASPETFAPFGRHDLPWRKSTHMPRWASRLTLDVRSVRHAELGTLTRASAAQTGATHARAWLAQHEPGVRATFDRRREEYAAQHDLTTDEDDARATYAVLWDAHRPRAHCFHKNPWVWRIEVAVAPAATEGTT